MHFRSGYAKAVARTEFLGIPLNPKIDILKERWPIVLEQLVAEVDKKKHISRITIVTEGTPQVIEQINLQLKKLVPVHKVADFKRNDKDILFRELALFKILANSKKQEKIKKICKKYNPVILDKSKKSFVIQVTALRAEIDKLTLDLKRFGLISTSRTGSVAMTKGAKIFN